MRGQQGGKEAKGRSLFNKTAMSPTDGTSPLTPPSEEKVADTHKKSDQVVMKYSLRSGIKEALRVALVGEFSSVTVT